jgi:hypothetical protein
MAAVEITISGPDRGSPAADGQAQALKARGGAAEPARKPEPRRQASQPPSAGTAPGTPLRRP